MDQSVIKSHSVCVCVRNTLSEPYYPSCVIFREQSCLSHHISESCSLLPSHEKEKREQLIFSAPFYTVFVVHLTVTYTSRLSSLVLYLLT